MEGICRNNPSLLAVVCRVLLAGGAGRDLLLPAAAPPRAEPRVCTRAHFCSGKWFQVACDTGMCVLALQDWQRKPTAL